MTQRCPQCNSPAARIEDGNYVCMMGGHFWPINGQKQITITTVYGERKKTMTEEIKKYPSGKKGICVNCRREVWINDKHGNCKSCSEVVKGLTPDTPEWVAALASVKELVTNKHFNKIRRKKTKGAVPDKPTPPPPPPPAVWKYQTNTDGSKDHAEKTALDVLKSERDTLLARLGKIDRAIEALTA